MDSKRMSLVILDYHIISLLRFISWVHYSNSTFCVSLISRLFYDDRVSLFYGPAPVLSVQIAIGQLNTPSSGSVWICGWLCLADLWWDNNWTGDSSKWTCINFLWIIITTTIQKVYQSCIVDDNNVAHYDGRLRGGREKDTEPEEYTTVENNIKRRSHHWSISIRPKCGFYNSR